MENLPENTANILNVQGYPILTSFNKPVVNKNTRKNIKQKLQVTQFESEFIYHNQNQSDFLFALQIFIIKDGLHISQNVFVFH